MPTEKPKIIFVADDELQNRLDDFRFENRIKTQSEAIRRLLDDALERYEKKAGFIKNKPFNQEGRAKIYLNNDQFPPTI